MLNDIFAELDGSSGNKNIIADRLNFAGLQVDDISIKITAEITNKLYQWGKSSFMLWSMIYDVKPNICICIFVSNGRLSFVLEVRRRILGFSKYHNI